LYPLPFSSLLSPLLPSFSLPSWLLLLNLNSLLRTRFSSARPPTATTPRPPLFSTDRAHPSSSPSLNNPTWTTPRARAPSPSSMPSLSARPFLQSASSTIIISNISIERRPLRPPLPALRSLPTSLQRALAPPSPPSLPFPTFLPRAPPNKFHVVSPLPALPNHPFICLPTLQLTSLLHFSTVGAPSPSTATPQTYSDLAAPRMATKPARACSTPPYRGALSGLITPSSS
jgi:hypothetical protein